MNHVRASIIVHVAAAHAGGLRSAATLRRGTSGRVQANAGHIASETKARAAAAVCANEDRPPAGRGNAATRIVASPPRP